MTSIHAALQEARAALTGLTDSDPEAESELLLEAALGKPRTYLVTWPERELSPSGQTQLQTLLQRRLQGEPIAYILGERGFWSLSLRVTPAVLIPRPETELLVELALDSFPAGRPIRAADLGTGSGAIAAALAGERTGWDIIATDLSTEALAVAKENFRQLGLGNIKTRQGAWCAALEQDERFDLVVSNPPYVEAGDPHLTRGDLRFEPLSALASGEDGLDDIRRIVEQAPDHLRPGGRLLLEHGWKQGEAARKLLRDKGFNGVETHQDLEGRDRVSGGRLG